VKLFTFPVGGQKWEGHAVRGSHKVFDGDRCHGVTLRDKCKVYYAREYPQPIFEDTFVHETFGHVAFYVSGVHQMILDLFPGEEERAEAFEEEAIRKLVPVWYPMLQHFEFKFPKGP
jgi:hypothetical protein